MRIPVRCRLHAARALAWLLAAAPAYGSGILARFLPGEAGGPASAAASYLVLRSEGPAGAPTRIGTLPAGADTLAFPDSSAAKGVAYAYRLVAVDSAGIESEASEPTWAAYPRLALPDTLRPAAGAFRSPLGASADPLKGLAGAPVLEFTLEPASVGSIAYDTSLGILVLVPRPGLDAPTRAVLVASYHGKFSDADTVTVMPTAAVPTAVLPVSRAGKRAAGKPGLYFRSGAGAEFRFDPAGRRLRILP